METIFLRRYHKEDHDAVFHLHVDAMKHAGTYVENDPSGIEWDADLKNIEGVYLHNRGEFYVAINDDRIVGMGAIRKVDDTVAEVKRMRVTPPLQGKGLGVFILDALIERAAELGYKKLILDVAEKQTGARHLYDTKGFTEYKRGQLAGQNTIFYEREL